MSIPVVSKSVAMWRRSEVSHTSGWDSKLRCCRADLRVLACCMIEARCMIEAQNTRQTGQLGTDSAQCLSSERRRWCSDLVTPSLSLITRLSQGAHRSSAIMVRGRRCSTCRFKAEKGTRDCERLDEWSGACHLSEGGLNRLLLQLLTNHGTWALHGGGWYETVPDEAELVDQTDSYLVLIS
jgi:hypothetical protein